MKTKKIELDIESIGSQSPLTKAEENLIAIFFSKRKNKTKITRSSKKPTVRRGVKISV
jgi:hypothetical protein